MPHHLPASQLFTRGQRVQPSDKGKAAHIFRPPYVHGTVVGFSRDHVSVRVRRDGYVEVGSYAPRFWEPETDPA